MTDTVMMARIGSEARAVLDGLLACAGLRRGDILVIGCSTSEVVGGQIGPPMFVSLVTHGLQAVVISVFAHYVMKKHPVLSSGIGAALGAVIMVVGYSLGRAFIYGTPEQAWLKLPYQILQATVGAVAGMVLVWKCGLHKLYCNWQAKHR